MSLDLLKILEKYGDLGQYAIPACMGSRALLTGNVTEALAMAILGYVQKIEVFAIKHHFPRERPEPYVMGMKSPEDSESFPSSHTGGAFLAVGLSYGLYGATHPNTITAIATATLVGLSRYLSRKHWVSDVIAGAIIGAFNGYAASKCRSIFTSFL